MHTSLWINNMGYNNNKLLVALGEKNERVCRGDLVDIWQHQLGEISISRL